jgi:MFS-type transporter involved in bile tolerance (Atg22 family)
VCQGSQIRMENLDLTVISNYSTAHSNIGYLCTLILNLSVLLPLQRNRYSNNLALCLTNSCSYRPQFPLILLFNDNLDWVILGIWWFIFQQKRPGPEVPGGSNYFTIGFKQIWLALREVRSLPQTFVYFVAYFLLADGLNTTGQLYNCHYKKSTPILIYPLRIGTLISIIQNNLVSFSFLQITYLGITQAVCSILSTFGFSYIQKYFKISTKSMFLCTNLFSVFIPLWGMIGLWTNRIGYHHIVGRPETSRTPFLC